MLYGPEVFIPIFLQFLPKSRVTKYDLAFPSLHILIQIQFKYYGSKIKKKTSNKRRCETLIGENINLKVNKFINIS